MPPTKPHLIPLSPYVGHATVRLITEAPGLGKSTFFRFASSLRIRGYVEIMEKMETTIGFRV